MKLNKKINYISNDNNVLKSYFDELLQKANTRRFTYMNVELGNDTVKFFVERTNIVDSWEYENFFDIREEGGVEAVKKYLNDERYWFEASPVKKRK